MDRGLRAREGRRPGDRRRRRESIPAPMRVRSYPVCRYLDYTVTILVNDGAAGWPPHRSPLTHVSPTLIPYGRRLRSDAKRHAPGWSGRASDTATKFSRPSPAFGGFVTGRTAVLLHGAHGQLPSADGGAMPSYKDSLFGKSRTSRHYAGRAWQRRLPIALHRQSSTMGEIGQRWP